MNHVPPSFGLERPRPGGGFAPSPVAPESLRLVDLDALVARGRRQIWPIVLCTLAGIALAAAYAFTATPLYTAFAQVLLENPRPTFMRDVGGSVEPVLDTAAIDSQVEILRSRTVAAAVVRDAKLATDPEFGSDAAGPVAALKAAIRGLLMPAGPVPANAAEEIAIAAFSNRLGAQRLGRTFLVDIAFTSRDPGKAASLANAAAGAFLTNQMTTKFDAARQAAGLLQDRVDDLRRRVIASDAAVQTYRAENGLVSAEGRTVGDQQLTELNTQLGEARAELARVQARYNRVRSIIQRGNPEAAASEAVDAPSLARLRTQYLDVAKNEGDALRRVGPNHVTVVTLRAELKQIERLMFDELRRVAESYRGDIDIARGRADALAENLNRLVAQNAAESASSVALRELERTADSYRTLYQSLLQRYQETMQQQALAMTDARIVVPAVPPGLSSFPNHPAILAAGAGLGLTAGAGLALLRERRDRSFRTGQQVRDALDLEVLGLLPDLGAASPGNPAARGEAARLRYALDQPFSPFAETLRSVKVAADIHLGDKRPKVIGVVSVLPNEGKTTVAKNLASLVAHLGPKTLLVDADLRNPGLTRALASADGTADGDMDPGLSDLLVEAAPLAGLVQREEASGLSILPAGSRRRLSHTSDLLAGPAMRGLLAQAGDAGFAYVVVDLPPLGPVIDVRAAAALFDGFVLVVQWGETGREVVRATLEEESGIASRCLGVVLNKVDARTIGLYEGAGAKSHYARRYGKYYSGA